ARVDQHGRSEPADRLAGQRRAERARGAEALPHRAGALADPDIDMSPGRVVPAAVKERHVGAPGLHRLVPFSTAASASGYHGSPDQALAMPQHLWYRTDEIAPGLPSHLSTGSAPTVKISGPRRDDDVRALQGIQRVLRERHPGGQEVLRRDARYPGLR